MSAVTHPSTAQAADHTLGTEGLVRGEIYMDEIVQASVLVPVLVIIALTVFAILRLARARGVHSRERGMDYYRTHQGPPEPDYVIVAARHYANLFETPMLFYAGAITVYVLNAVTAWVLVFAWGYAVSRVLQSAIHLTYNNPGHRGVAFLASWLFLIALWISNGVAIFRLL